MKASLFIPVLWLTSVTAAGLLRGPASAGTTFLPNTEQDAIRTYHIPMRRHILAPSASHPSLQRRANVSARLRNIYDVYYIIDLGIGNQTIPVSVDTGSSDTWVVQQPYECVSYWFDPNGTAPDCGLGSGFKGNLSGGIVPNVPPFARSYVDGTFVDGYYGLEDVTIGGIKAHNQRLAIVNYTYWRGDGQTSGLLGLGYPYLTSLDGSDQNQPAYDPVFTTMWKSGAIEPIFSLGLSRNENTTTRASTEQVDQSYLTLGGLPPVDVDNKTWAATEILNMASVPEWGFKTDERGMYIIKPDAFVIESKGNGSAAGDVVVKNTTQIPVVIDVGATLTYLPTDLVNQVYAAFDPPAQYNSDGGLFYALCNATIPKFGVQIANSTFYMDPADLLRQTARDTTGAWCRVGVTDTDSPPHVLGVSFLTNVVAVFDVGKSEMRFAARTKY